jgi:WD40 repeat protein
MTAFNAADQKVKQVAPIAMKALDEKSNAERNHKAAQRSVERAEEAVKKAIEAIPGFEAALKQSEEAVKQLEMQLQAAQAAEKEAEKPLRTVALSADGAYLATGGDDGKVHVWDAQSGTPVETFGSQNAPIKQVAFTPNGIAAFAANNTGMLWTLSTEWKLERTIGNPNDPQQIVDRVTALDFSHDSKMIATGSGEPSRSGEIKIWSVENGQLIRGIKEPHSDTVFGLEFSPDDALIASCGADRFMKVFRTNDATFVRSYEGHTHHVTGVSWRADGRVLATCGADSVVKIWDARTGDQQRTIQGLNKEGTSLRFVADGDGVVVTSGANLVRMVNATNGGNLRDFPGNLDYMFSVAASADGKTIAAGGQESILRVWNDNGQLVVAFDPPKLEKPKTEAAAAK